MKLLGRLSAADVEIECLAEALGDIDEVALHALDVFFWVEAWCFSRELFVEFLDVVEDVALCGVEDGLIGERGLDLLENPWIANGTAPDHESVGLCLLVVGEGGFGVNDVAVGDDGAGEGLFGEGDELGVDGCLVAFFDGASVDA